MSEAVRVDRNSTIDSWARHFKMFRCEWCPEDDDVVQAGSVIDPDDCCDNCYEYGRAMRKQSGWPDHDTFECVCPPKDMIDGELCCPDDSCRCWCHMQRDSSRNDDRDTDRVLVGWGLWWCEFCPDNINLVADRDDPCEKCRSLGATG